ncbi:hypothetical protein JSY36_01590 [Bacillus sp. H-16]|uniref:hypothetical protein n=1 Tax=Alteribacter salitolerans TaxID=2912333 RepID=UPI0019633086|nr:hypothetical protein [Alteribacter salitolerans]MBM7094433.1 hypothetical protein [Alteribacter salitolerans]
MEAAVGIFVLITILIITLTYFLSKWSNRKMVIYSPCTICFIFFAVFTTLSIPPSTGGMESIGYSVFALILLYSGLTGLVTAFIFNRTCKRKETGS